MSKTKPLPECIEAQITGLSHDGRGVARNEGKVVFIDDALPGEHVLYRSGRRRRSHGTGTLDTIISASPDRVEPECEYFGTCGGCALQHLNIRAQREHKTQTLLDNLSRLGGVEPEDVLAPLYGSQWGYRRKARLGVRMVPKKGGALVGFRERRHSFVTPLSRCLILDRRVSDLLVPLRELISTLSCPNRIPQIEVAVSDDAVALVVRHLQDFTDSDRNLLKEFAQSYAVQLFLQPGGLDTVAALWPEQAETLVYGLPDSNISITFQATDFIQVNSEVNRMLVTRVCELLDLDARDKVLDLFCGLGNFSLAMARKAAHVTGIEGEQALVDRADQNAERNEVRNIEFIAADLYQEVLAGSWREQHYDKVLLDPPRTGAVDLIEIMPEFGATKIVYVSCNPATLARDAGVLVKKLGYRLRCAGIVDMFPHTAHLESVAVFEPSRVL